MPRFSVVGRFELRTITFNDADGIIAPALMNICFRKVGSFPVPFFFLIFWFFLFQWLKDSNSRL